MQNIVLFHHDPSPYGERIRKCFGLQNIPWKSCLVPMVMPRPEMTMLSGGYRKIPVIQYGADIYFDTILLSQKISLNYKPENMQKNKKGAHLIKCIYI